MTAPQTRAGRRSAAPQQPLAVTDGTGMTGFWQRAQRFLPTLIALALLLGLLIYAEIAYGRVFHAGTMSDLLVGSAPMLILAVGMTIVIISA